MGKASHKKEKSKAKRKEEDKVFPQYFKNVAWENVKFVPYWDDFMMAIPICLTAPDATTEPEQNCKLFKICAIVAQTEDFFALKEKYYIREGKLSPDMTSHSAKNLLCEALYICLKIMKNRSWLAFDSLPVKGLRLGIFPHIGIFKVQSYDDARLWCYSHVESLPLFYGMMWKKTTEEVPNVTNPDDQEAPLNHTNRQ